MSKTKISDIGWGIEAGENRAAKQGILQEAIKAGSLIFMNVTKKIFKATSSLRAGGILDKHYDVDLDTAIASGYGGRMITRGYVNIICDDPDSIKEIGEPVFDTPTNAGIAPWSAGGDKLGNIVDRVPDNDTVCKIFIDRG
ncbi:hypothetical protein LCGC14_1107240 [marine sediment metagenome]|uniref:Uncharacterized protein n=1 Tax=marine sediment metagenome TaxID=412755 RepID=A0A0F9MVN5_9ZZZZ